MARKKVDTWIVVEDSLCPVAVMHVPIDDRHAFNVAVLLLSIPRGDSDVVKKTKPHCALIRRVMTGRTDGNECIGDFAGHYQINCLTRGSSRMSSSIE